VREPQGYLDELELLDARRFEIAVRRLADSLSHGSDRSPFLGSGFEYVQSRPYQPGDPQRAVDWRVTARTGRFFVKQHEAPKCVPVQLVIDTSASMTVSSLRRSKYATALFLAGGIALACLERASPVGVVGAGSGGFLARPSLSRTRILEWLLRLRRFRFDESTELARRLAELAPRLTERALVVVLSDLHDPDALGALKLLAQRHDVAVLQLLDPAELFLGGAGLMRVREAETGREFATHGRRAHVDPAVTARALLQGGIDHLLVRTDREHVHAVRRFFAARGGLGRKAR
jgi:uncharacterized protein (DUF58 family)